MSDKATKPFADVEAFLFDKGKVVREDGKATSLSLTQNSYVEFAESQGVEAAQLKAVANVNKQIVGGLTVAAATLLNEDIAAARKAGVDTEDLKVKVHVQRYDGAYKGYMIPERIGRNPRNPGETTTTHGAFRLSVQTRTVQSDEALAYAAATVKAALK